MGVQRAIAKGTLGGLIQIRNMFTADVTPTGGDTSELLWETYLDGIYTNVEELTTSVMMIAYYELQLPAGGTWETFAELETEHAGAVESEALPNLVAAVFTGTASGGGHRGRKFFSGLAESVCTGNAISAGNIARAALVLANYITPLTGLGGGLLVPGVTDDQGNFHAFVGGTISSLLGTMRRRKPGLGI